MTCTHYIEKSRYIETDYYGDPCEGYWEFWTESATEDIDTHRYRCTLCKKVMYYSGRARDFFERGIESEIPGLNNASRTRKLVK